MAEDGADDVALRRSLDAMTAVLRSGRDGHSTVTELIRLVTELTPWDICWAALFDPAVEHIVVQHGSGFGVPFSAAAYEGWPIKDSLSAQAIRSGRPIEIADVDDAEHHPLVQADAAVRGFRSALILPFRVDGTDGALWLCRPDPHEFSDAERVLGYAISSLVSSALAAGRPTPADRGTSVPARPAKPDTTVQKENLERVSAIHERLMQQVINDHGVAKLAERAAQLLEKPVLLFDQFDHVVCAADGFEPYAGSRIEAVLGPQLRTGFTNRPARAAHVIADGERYLVVPIASEGRSLGNLCVRYGDSVAAELEVQIAEQVGLFFALELLKERIRLDVALRLNGDFFASLLSNEARTSQPLLEQAALRGLDLIRPSVVIRARISPPPADDWYDITAGVAWRLRSLIARLGPHASAVTYPSRHAEMVFVVNGDPLPELREQILPTVRAAVSEILQKSGLRQFTISTGVGKVGRGLEGVRASHETSLKALSVVDMLGVEGSDIDLNDFAAYELLLAIPPDQRAGFVDNVLGAIIEYDAAHSAEFLRTLSHYLDSFGSVQRTAEALFLHATTVRYRLGRIEELSGLKLDNSEHRLSLAVALRLHRLRQPA